MCLRGAVLLALVMGAFPTHAEDWRTVVDEQLKIFGHRNIIVVADSAYPSQSNPSVTTIITGEDHAEVVATILGLVEAQRHVQGLMILDAELAYVPEDASPGVSDFRDFIDAALGDRNVRYLLHENIIKYLDERAQLFEVLVVKTNGTIPYTSVFIELDAGYWDASREKALRQAMSLSP